MNPQSFIAPLSLIVLTFFLHLISSASCFDITKMLDSHSDFSTFNDYLTQTQLNTEINRRQTITVLAVANSAMGGLSGKSADVIKKVMAVHVVLGYYDVSLLQKLPNKTTIVTTLFQSTGFANGQQGHLNITVSPSGEVAFGSAVPGSPLGSKLVKSVADQSWNISVLQVSAVIMPSGIDSSNNNAGSNTTTSPPGPPPPPSAAPVAAPPRKALTPSKAPSKSPTAKAPAPSKDASTEPTPADTPSTSPSQSPADGPPADSTKGSGARVTSGIFLAALMVVVSSLFGF